jgi:hypothetical protein
VKRQALHYRYGYAVMEVFQAHDVAVFNGDAEQARVWMPTHFLGGAYCVFQHSGPPSSKARLILTMSKVGRHHGLHWRFTASACHGLAENDGPSDTVSDDAVSTMPSAKRMRLKDFHSTGGSDKTTIVETTSMLFACFSLPMTSPI